MISIDAYNTIAALDLDRIKMKLMHQSGEGWSQEKADAVEVEYRRFLYLTKVYPQEQVSPLVEVDVFWHYHILDTMKYAQDCEQAFGFFVHHQQYMGMEGTDEDTAEHGESIDRMRELYEDTFEDAYGSNVVAFGRESAAFCARTPVAAGAAFCGRLRVDTVAAFCARLPASTTAAFCARTPVETKAAFCARTPVETKAAFCARTPLDTKAAFCARTPLETKAAFCARMPVETKAAFCARTPVEAKSAFCARGAVSALSETGNTDIAPLIREVKRPVAILEMAA